jgi:DNA-binding response OmpR family regulator
LIGAKRNISENPLLKVIKHDAIATLVRKMLESPNKSFNFVASEQISILAIDDDPLQREFSSVYLSTPQINVQTAASAHEGLALLLNGTYSIALIDVDMPGKNGIELLREIRAIPRFDDLPIMIITGREDMMSIDLAYEAGATAFMCKPVNWRLLSHQVKFLLRAHKAIRQLDDHLEQAAKETPHAA